MPGIQTYKNWKTVTEADFVSLFIKTWFAYISTLREMFPEAKNTRGDGKYISAYKNYFVREGKKKLIIDSTIMGHIETLYREGKKMILNKYPEYYLWDFYRINESFEFTYRDVPPDKSECLIVGMKMNRNRGTKWSFIITGFVRMFGTHYGVKYNDNVQFSCNISDILSKSTEHLKKHPNISEQDYLSWLLREVNAEVCHCLIQAFKENSEKTKYSSRMLVKLQSLEKRAISIIWSVFSLNAKDDSNKTIEEMHQSRNTYEIISQVPLNYFEYHMQVDLQPQGKTLTAFEENWYKKLHETKKTTSIVWFLSFVYRLRNALFHEIINPLDEEWQIIFKNAYLVLKEIVDLNINELNAN